MVNCGECAGETKLAKWTYEGKTFGKYSCIKCGWKGKAFVVGQGEGEDKPFEQPQKSAKKEEKIHEMFEEKQKNILELSKTKQDSIEKQTILDKISKGISVCLTQASICVEKKELEPILKMADGFYKWWLGEFGKSYQKLFQNQTKDKDKPDKSRNRDTDNKKKEKEEEGIENGTD